MGAGSGSSGWARWCDHKGTRKREEEDATAEEGKAMRPQKQRLERRRHKPRNTGLPKKPEETRELVCPEPVPSPAPPVTLTSAQCN